MLNNISITQWRCRFISIVYFCFWVGLPMTVLQPPIRNERCTNLKQCPPRFTKGRGEVNKFILGGVMNIIQQMYASLCLVVVCSIVVLVAPVYGESIFLKDGSIVEGDIVKETDKAMDVKLPDGNKITIPRKDIVRTLVNTNYKTKMYIMKTNKEVLPVYIVEEDNESYTYRNELQSADEYKISKGDVLFLSKIPPQDWIADEVQKKVNELGVKKHYTWEQKVKWRAPLFRFGYSNIGKYADSDIDDAYSDSRDINAFIDLFPLRFRNESGSGFDVMMRVRAVGNFDEPELYDEKTQLLSKLFDVTIGEEYEAQFNIGMIGGGIRYAYTLYYGVAIQPYVFGLINYVVIDQIKVESTTETESFDEKISSSKYGFQAGVGVDIGLTPHIGIFVEGMYGYISAKFNDGKKHNIDGYYIYYGVTWRTSYGLID